MVGWALNHVAGRVVRGVDEAPTPVWTHREQKRFVTAINQTNDEALERTGADYNFNDPEKNRQILIAFLQSFGAGHPLFEQSVEALTALSFGEVHPLIRPSSFRSGDDAYGLWKTRLRAVGYVHFLQGRGMTKGEARAKIGSLYGVDEDTIKSWETRCKKRFGVMHSINNWSVDYAAGRSVKAWQDNGSPPVVDGLKPFGLRTNLAYSEDAMRKAARAFKALAKK